MRYERVALIKPQHHAQLLADLQERTRLPVKRGTRGRINFRNDSAELWLYDEEPRAQRMDEVFHDDDDD